MRTKAVGVGMFLIIVATVLFIEALWALDFAMWYRSVHSYYPWEWGNHYGGNGAPLCDVVNIKYYQATISFAIATIGAYIIGVSTGVNKQKLTIQAPVENSVKKVTTHQFEQNNNYGAGGGIRTHAGLRHRGLSPTPLTWLGHPRPNKKQ